MSRYRINPGEFRHIITFQEMEERKNSLGEMTKVWIDRFSTRAAIYPISGKEFFTADMNNSEVSHKINIRYRGDINTKMRIIFEGRVFNIESIINFQERNILIQIMAKELFND